MITPAYYPRQKIQLKTPLKYYGSKNNLSPLLLNFIPEHYTYVEPFFGAGALYFAKEPSPNEIINDKNDFVVNFFRVLQNKEQFEDFLHRITYTLYAQSEFKRAGEIYKNPHNYSPVEKAWAAYVIGLMSFSYTWDLHSFAVHKKKNIAARVYQNKNNQLLKKIEHNRLKNTIITATDALDTLRLYDSEKAFFYLDPPYINGQPGRNYTPYTLEEFEELLQKLTQLKGKFLLSHYPHPLLDKYVQQNNWHMEQIQMYKASTQRAKDMRKKVKIECLIYNYPSPLEKNRLL